VWLRLARQRPLFDLAPIRRRSVASLWTAVRRTTIHLLVRLAVTASCMSSAAAFDSTHLSRMTVTSMSGCSGQSVSAAVEAPSFRTTGRAFRARSQPASQREVGVQSGEPEEIGKQ
jgi:hypothetical protein